MPRRRHPHGAGLRPGSGPVGLTDLVVTRLEELPLLVMFAIAGAVAMLVPAAFAMIGGEERTGRIFLFWSLLILVICGMVAATGVRRRRRPVRDQLLSLLLAFSALPLVLALPFAAAVPNTTLVSSWLEMVSAFTTTGLTLYEPARLPDAVHLWRGLIGWLGGLFIWVTAVAILAPNALGGFELEVAPVRMRRMRHTRADDIRHAGHRVTRIARDLAPAYAGLTFALALLLAGAGERPLTAVIHAMSTMATSGISPVGGLSNGEAGIGGEIVIALFFVFAFSRVSFAARRGSLSRDPELRLAATLIALVSVFLFARHWIGAAGQSEGENVVAALGALWGSVFTTASFLSTTGFESAYWQSAREWSHLQAPGLALMGLALIGGGVATTAGGVKLLRVHALGDHALRELDRLVLPSSIGGASFAPRAFRRRGAQIAWVFLMLFAFSVGGLTLALCAAGAEFAEGLLLSIASLSNTGPLTGVTEAAVDVIELTPPAKALLAVGMVVGRMELLAIIALLNPDLWRN